MSTMMEKLPGDMNLADLASRCSLEMSKFRRKQSCDDQYCLELFHRAILHKEDGAWDVLYTSFSEHVRLWFRTHEYREAALRHDSEQSYIDDTFKRFWQWTSNLHLEFQTLAAALRSLSMCLNCSIMDVLRAYSRPQEEQFPEGTSQTDSHLLIEDAYHEDDWLQVVMRLLPNERERRVIYLQHHCGLKPREIMQRCPGEFADKQEIFRLTRNAMDRLRRNIDKLRWRLGEGEV